MAVSYTTGDTPTLFGEMDEADDPLRFFFFF